MSLLSVENLGIAYRIGDRQFDAVHDVSFDVGEGATVALVGESGSGKSTIGLSILGLLPRNGQIRTGRLIFDGKNIVEMNAAELRSMRWTKISMIFQGSMNALDPVYKIKDQLGELLRFHHKMNRREALGVSGEFIEKVGLKSSVLDLFPHELSGGMKQRVVIAMSLILNPELLIADEPTTALDVTTQAEIVNLMRDIVKEREMSMIFITHDLSLVPLLSDEVVVMYGGTTMERGLVKEVFRHPLNPYTQALMNSVVTLRSKGLEGIPGDPPTIESVPSACPFQTRCDSVFDQCRERLPLEIEVENRKVRCHLFGSR